MNHEVLQRHLDSIMAAAIPPDVFAREQKWRLFSAQRKSERLDEQGKYHSAEQHAARVQQLGHVERNVLAIARTTPFTIEGILSGEISIPLDPLNQRSTVFIDGFVYTIVSAAIVAYLDQNREAVDDLISILPRKKTHHAGSDETEQKKDDLKYELINIMQDGGWDDKIREKLLSTTDAGEEFSPMPSGYGRKK